MQNQANKFYVYLLIDPVSKRPVYVGKGSGARCYSHIREAKGEIKIKGKNTLKLDTIKSIIESGQEPIVVLVEKYLSNDDAYELEKDLIKIFGRSGIDDNGWLTNRVIDQKSLGGGHKGMRHSKPRSLEHRQKIRECRTGHIPSEETRALWSSHRKGRKHTENTINKMKVARKGHKNANALMWVITKPDGSVNEVTGLRTWCVDNDLNFYDVYNSKNGFVSVKLGKGRGGGRKNER